MTASEPPAAQAKIKTAADLIKLVRVQFVVALMVGLVLGTVIGIGEGVWVLYSQEVFGRYNELLAWAILIDAGGMIALELALGLIACIFLSLFRLLPSPRQLVPLQLGATAFALALGWGLWWRGLADPSAFFTNASAVIVVPAILGFALGEAVLAGSMWVTARVPFVYRIKGRYWLFFEGAVMVAAVALTFIR